MSSRSMDCNELVELVTAYFEGSLDPETRERFDLHLLDCDGCGSYLQQFSTTVTTFGTLRDDDIEPEFRDRLLGAFRGWR